MISSDGTSTAHMPPVAAPPIQQTYQSASMYHMNDPQNLAVSIHSIENSSVMPGTNLEPQPMEYQQQQAMAPPPVKPGPYSQALFGTVQRYSEHEDKASTQHMLVEGMENRQGMPMVDEVDARSVFVGNVDYGTTPPELQAHFKSCGPINRITIMIDRYTGHPKGYAYIEFQDESAIPHAIALNQSIFRDRPLKVVPKRKNMPGYSSGRGSMSHGPMNPANSFPTNFFRGRMRGRGRGAYSYNPRYRGRGMRGPVFPY